MTEPAKPPQRRPTDEDVPAILEAISEGKALRAVCRELGLHAPSTSTFLKSDPGLCERYAHARVDRVDVMGEEVLNLARAAALGMPVNGKKVDAQGVRVFIDAVKWLAGRMDPKGGQVTRFSHEFESLTDAELDARLAVLEAAAAQHADPDALGED